MILDIIIPDEYQSMIDVIVADTKKQNPDRDDVRIGLILEQICRKFIIESHAQIMMNLPNPEDAE